MESYGALFGNGDKERANNKEEQRERNRRQHPRNRTDLGAVIKVPSSRYPATPPPRTGENGINPSTTEITAPMSALRNVFGACSSVEGERPAQVVSVSILAPHN